MIPDFVTNAVYDANTQVWQDRLVVTKTGLTKDALIQERVFWRVAKESLSGTPSMKNLPADSANNYQVGQYVWQMT